MTRKLLRNLAGFVSIGAVGVMLGMLWLYVPDPGAGAPRVLVSVDRTLWNAVGLNRLTYVRKLRLEGLRPVLVRFPRAGSESTTPGVLFEGVQGLVLTGGGDVAAERYGGDPGVVRDVKPRRDRFELALLDAAAGHSLPVLALCRGAQLVNVARGGTLGDFRSDETRFGLHKRLLSGHPVVLEPDSRLAGLYGVTELDDVTSWHGQHVAVPGENVRIVAHAHDGTPEAIEIDSPEDRWIIGIQWHAEMPPWDRRQSLLFEAFAEVVRETPAVSARYEHAATKRANRRR